MFSCAKLQDQNSTHYGLKNVSEVSADNSFLVKPHGVLVLM